MGTVVANKTNQAQTDPTVLGFRLVDADAVTGSGILYYKEISPGVNELFARDPDGGGQIIQLTDGTGLNVDLTTALILAGQSGGQTAHGGTASGENLVLRSTTNATKGNIIVGDDGGNLYVGTISPVTFTAAQAIGQFVRNHNDNTSLGVFNSENNTSARARLDAICDEAEASVQATARNLTPSSLLEADSVHLVANALTSAVIVGTSGTAPIKFKHGTSEQMRIVSTGGVYIGTNAAIGAELVIIQDNDNGDTALRIANTDTGVNANAEYIWQSGSGNTAATGTLFAFHNAATPASPRQASEIVMSTQNNATNPVSILLQTRNSAPVRIATNDTLRAQFLAGANTLQGNAGFTLQGGSGVHTLTLSGGASSGSTVTVGDANELIGLYGVTAVTRSSGWTITNDLTDRNFDADTVTTAELADVVATFIRDVARTGLIGAVS